jgi:uncharacterized protein (TIGR00290 family)
MGGKRKIVASYSGGKDGALALWRAVRGGCEPVGLLTTYNVAAGRSWFHGVPEEVLECVAELMGLPLELVRTGAGEDYGKNFEAALSRRRELVGARACVFGDIDIQEHYAWCSSRCAAAGMDSVFPLWNEGRDSLVYELIDSGFEAIITVVDTSRLSESFLGATLTREVADEIAAAGADICGENGEYHTFVRNCPLFRGPAQISLGATVRIDNYAMAPVALQKDAAAERAADDAI